MFAHGGGAFPGTLPRIDWGWRCRPDLCAKAPQPHLLPCSRRRGVDMGALGQDSDELPSVMAKKIYVDSLTHDVGTPNPAREP